MINVLEMKKGLHKLANEGKKSLGIGKGRRLS
jgi:hypothetical protein